MRDYVEAKLGQELDESVVGFVFLVGQLRILMDLGKICEFIARGFDVHMRISNFT